LPERSSSMPAGIARPAAAPSKKGVGVPFGSILKMK
jgi:hypothetical protein